MTTKELRNNIDKVLGNSIRCLLPSYWWKRLFHQVTDTIDEVANTIDDINDISIVDSESKLLRLDVPNGSVASVYNERKFKFSECYKPTEEDAKLSNDEFLAKLTRVKAIGVNYPLPEPLEKEVGYTLIDYISKNEQGEIDCGMCFIGYLKDFGWCAYAFYSYDALVTIFLLNTQSEVVRFNEYLSQRNFLYSFDDGEDMTDEDYSVLESVYSVVEADTNVYVKGTSWEKLAKDGNVDNGGAVSTKHIVYVPKPDSDDTISDIQRNENIKVINLIIGLYKQGLTELSDIVLSVDNGAYYITPSLCQPANAGEDFKLCVIFTGLLGDGSDLVVVLYQDGTVEAVTRKADTELSTTSTNPVQNKVITSALDSKVDKAALDVSNLTTYQEYANAFEAAGYGKGDYYIGFKYRGATAFYFSRTSYRIEIKWVDLVGSVWTSTISNGSNATMRHRCISGGFLHIGNNVAEAEKAENVFMLADSRPTNTTVLFHYDYSTAVAFVKYTQPDAENIDVTFINPQYQYETWRINIKTGESTYVSVEELNIVVDSELSTTSTNAVQNKVIKAYVDTQIAQSITTTLNTAV